MNHRAREIVDSFDQEGLLLLQGAATPTARWKREIERIVMSPAQIEAMRIAPQITRAALRAWNTEAVAQRPSELTEVPAVVVESDMQNRDVAMPVVGSMVPYELSNDPLGVPFPSLVWPTVTPSFPAERQEPGAKWPGAVDISVGAARIALSYMVTLTKYEEQDPVIEVVLAPDCKPAVIDRITLAPKVAGRWTCRIDRDSGSWHSCAGEFALNVGATYPFDDEQHTIQAIAYKTTFRMERVPIAFDEKDVFPAAWLKLEHARAAASSSSSASARADALKRPG